MVIASNTQSTASQLVVKAVVGAVVAAATVTTRVVLAVAPASPVTLSEIV